MPAASPSSKIYFVTPLSSPSFAIWFPRALISIDGFGHRFCSGAGYRRRISSSSAGDNVYSSMSLHGRTAISVAFRGIVVFAVYDALPHGEKKRLTLLPTALHFLRRKLFVFAPPTRQLPTRHTRFAGDVAPSLIAIQKLLEQIRERYRLAAESYYLRKDRTFVQDEEVQSFFIDGRLCRSQLRFTYARTIRAAALIILCRGMSAALSSSLIERYSDAGGSLSGSS